MQAYDARAVPLHLVKTANKRKAKAGPMIECHRCGGREVMQTRIGMLMIAGKPTGGTKALICAGCHRKGERVVLG